MSAGLTRAVALAALALAVACEARAIDARELYVQAERRTYRLSTDGVRTFSCRVSSPLIDQFSDPGGPLQGSDVRFMLWWQAPGRSAITLQGDGGRLTESEREQVVGFFEPLLELVAPVPPSERLRDHVFTFPPDAPVGLDGSRVVEARAVDPNDSRRLARFTIEGSGLVVRETTVTADGETADLWHDHQRAEDGAYLLSRVRGSHRGAAVELQLDWAPLEGRHVPVRVRVRQRRHGSPAADDVTYYLTDHRVDAPVPTGILSDRPGSP